MRRSARDLAELNATPGDVMIEVLEEPNTGSVRLWGARGAGQNCFDRPAQDPRSAKGIVEAAQDEPDSQDSLPLDEVA